MFIEQPPAAFRWLFRSAICRKKASPKVVYLTFDDGPCPNTTPRILDILDEFGVKATFFCVGNNVKNNLALFDEIRRRGHAVGNHTMNHTNGYRRSTKKYIYLVDKANELIQSRLFRPPYGRIKPQQYWALKKRYTIVLWDLITRDYNMCLLPEDVVAIVKRYARNGSVIVFHDSLKSQRNVLGALPESIRYLQSKGYRFELITPKEQ